MGVADGGATRGGSRSDLPWLVPTLAGLVGGVTLIATLGPALVHPGNIDWLMRGDFSLHFLGWHLYRASPWTVPLGATPLLIWPVGSSVGLTDSIPIAAFLFKMLDPLLPPVFQFIGLWLATSFALQGVFGALLMRLATPRPVLQFLGALLFVLSPPLVFRFGHAALTAHWLLLAALWRSLGDEADRPTRGGAGWWALLCALAAAIQPYLLLMVVVLMLAAHVRQLMAVPHPFLRVAVSASAALAAAWLGLWQSGSLMVEAESGLSIGGFDVFSANLLTFVMPTEGPTLLTPGPIPYASGFQYEGYAYLGLGVLLLGMVALVASLASGRATMSAARGWRHTPLVLALLFLTLMALGPTITAGSRTLLTYDLRWWGPLLAFRTHARMIWPLYYAVVVAILFATCRLGHRRGLGLLAAAVIVQGADLAGMSRSYRELGIRGFRDPLASRFWAVAPPSYERLVLVPSNVCDRDGSVNHLPFSLLAGRHGLAINAGTTARYDTRRAAAYCEALDREVREGLGAPGSLYIVRPDLLSRVAPAAAAGGTTCTVVDGFGVCFSDDSYGRWRDAFEVPRGKLPPTEELVRFHAALDEIHGTLLRQPAHAAPGELEHRLEGLVRYLADRLEGCDRGEATARALAFVTGGAAAARCATVSTRPELPAEADTRAFAARLGDALAARPGGASSPSHVDRESEAVWLQAYVAQRLEGRSAPSARDAVLEAVRTGRR